MTLLRLDLFAWAMLLIFLVIHPLLGRVEIRSLRDAPARQRSAVRMRMYRRTMELQWGLTIAFLGIWVLMRRGLGPIGLNPQTTGWQWLGIALASGLTWWSVWYFSRVAKDATQLQKVRDQLGEMEAFAPYSPTELRRFSWLSVTAGICEEILYRGLLMTVLAQAFGIWPAVVGSSVVFGMGHIYQGAGGALKAGAVGLLLAGLVVLSGSLYAAIVLHAVGDIAQGRLLHAAANSSSEPPRVPTVA